MQFHYLPDGPAFDADKVRARWAAAKADYLAGGGAPEVCERHALSLRTFRWRAKKEGWRRMDQPAPSLAPDPAPAPAPAPDREPAPAPPPQDAPLVIPDAPTGASRDGTPSEQQAPPLTAAQMVEKCWSHIQAAVAAGRVIEARGWMRLYKELKPFARYEATAAREARMEQEAADRRAAEAAADEAPLVIPEAPSGAIRDVALPLHCFSAPESHTPSPANADPIADPAAAEAATPISTSDLARLAARLATVAQQVEQAAHHEAVRLPLHCFSAPESYPGQGP